MTNFNPDPRVRDREPNATALGPNFPGSLGDLARMSYRPSQEFLRYVTMAIANDDGSRLTEKLEALLRDLEASDLAVAQSILAQLEQGLTIANQPIRVASRTVQSDMFSPVGVAPGAAYADLDAIGTNAVGLAVPKSGIIQSAIYYDRDDEGLQVDLWLFSEPPAAQTDNGAFTLSDTGLSKVIDVIQFSGFRDATNGQVSTQNGLGIAYVTAAAADGQIYVQLQARGALNIAAGALPAFRLTILADE